MGKAVLKVEGGKLVKVEASERAGRLERVKITGDFFVHPEEALAQMEKALVGVPVDEQEIIEALDARVKQLNAQLVGFSTKDIAKAIMQALEQEQK